MSGEQPKPQFVIEYDPETQATTHRITGPIPMHVLTNALSVAHFQFTSQQFAAMMQAAQSQQQKRVVIPGGAPIPPLRG